MKRRTVSGMKHLLCKYGCDEIKENRLRLTGANNTSLFFEKG
jgi:hypothetical protein